RPAPAGLIETVARSEEQVRCDERARTEPDAGDVTGIGINPCEVRVPLDVADRPLMGGDKSHGDAESSIVLFYVLAVVDAAADAFNSDLDEFLVAVRGDSVCARPADELNYAFL